MLKVLFFVLLLSSSLLSSETATATKIVQAIVATINTSAKPIWLEEGIDKLLDVDQFTLSRGCEDAEVLVVEHHNAVAKECMHKPIVVLDYDLLKAYENSVAAFFWKKGRPNIVFIKHRVEKFNIKLPKSYEAYQEEKIW